jgi:hypothetical protein
VKRFISIIFICLFFSSCNKKKKAPEESPPPPVVVSETPCLALPETPSVGWRDSSNVGDKNVNAFFYNPVKPDQIIYIANGDAFGTNKMFAYNVPASPKVIDNVGFYLPQINKLGWVIYSNIDNNIFLWKSVPDSLIQITTNNRNHNPQWDHTGTAYYYFRETTPSNPGQLQKFGINGNFITEVQMDLPHVAVFKKTDKIIYLKVQDHDLSMILKDMVTLAEQKLITRPTYSKPGQISFENMAMDNNDENVYWSNSNGIFRCHVASLKVDTLFKNCETQIFDNPVISTKLNEITYSHHVITPINSYILYHQYRAMEYNTVTGQTAELKLFP